MSQKTKEKKELIIPVTPDHEEIAGYKKKIRLLCDQLTQSQDMYRKLNDAYEANQNTVHLVASNSSRNAATRNADSVSPGDTSSYKAITSLNQENRVLLNLVKELMRDRSIAQCKGLMLEQIMDMSDAEYRSVVRVLSKEVISQREENNQLASTHRVNLKPRNFLQLQTIALPSDHLAVSVIFWLLEYPRKQA